MVTVTMPGWEIEPKSRRWRDIVIQQLCVRPEDRLPSDGATADPIDLLGEPFLSVRWRAWMLSKRGYYDVYSTVAGDHTLLVNVATSDIATIESLLATTRVRERSGRPRGTGRLDRISETDFRNAYIEEWREAKKRSGEAPTLYDLAARFGVTRHTIWRFRQERGIPWPPITNAELLQQS